MDQQAQSEQTPSATTPTPGRAPRGANRCRHRSNSNGRCRLPIQDPDSGLCFVHAARIRKTTYAFDDTSDLSADLFGPSSPAPSFEAPEHITAVLTNLVVLVAQGRLSPRRAAVISYALSHILRGLQAIDKKAGAEPVDYIFDIPCAAATHALERQAQERQAQAEAQAQTQH